MQRIERNLKEPIKEEWTKYFVNDVECERDAIYQTVLDHKFYNGEVKLIKKYHYELHEEKQIESSQIEAFENIFKSFFDIETNENKEQKNQSANFSLDTKEFAKKVDPRSADYKSLIDKMTLALDFFYEAQQDNAKYSDSLRAAIKDCMNFMVDKTAKSKGTYDNLIHQFSVEYYAFAFDTLTLFSSSLKKIGKNKTNSTNFQQPSLAYDTSSIKDQWNESWQDKKKSNYINKYLEIMLKQTDPISQGWIMHPVFANTFDNQQVQNKFNDFKDLIKSLQKKLKEHDKTLGKNTSIGNVFSIFSRFTQSNTTNSNTNASPNMRRPK